MSSRSNTKRSTNQENTKRSENQQNSKRSENHENTKRSNKSNDSKISKASKINSPNSQKSIKSEAPSDKNQQAIDLNYSLISNEENIHNNPTVQAVLKDASNKIRLINEQKDDAIKLGEILTSELSNLQSEKSSLSNEQKRLINENNSLIELEFELNAETLTLSEQCSHLQNEKIL